MKARHVWAHVKRQSTGAWDYVIYEVNGNSLRCHGTAGVYPTWQRTFEVAHASVTRLREVRCASMR